MNYEGIKLPPQNQRATSKLVAFIAIMCALANVLGFFTIPLGIVTIHLMQLPIILTGLALGPRAGGLVGFIGAASMAFRLTPSNPYILFGNGILGFFIGLFYLRLKKTGGRPIIPQVISVLGAYVVQFPYVYVTDVYFMSMPSTLVLTVILPKLLLENVVSVLLAHFILFRVHIEELLQ